MAEEVQGDVVDTPTTTTEGTTPEVEATEEVKLPSDQEEFVVPEKFEGKSLEDVIKSYQELEKLKGGDEVSEEKSPEEVKPTEGGEEEQYQKYAESLDKNGELSAEEYAELEKAGYDKATVDAEIQRRADLKEFEEYKKEKALNEVLEPLGGGTEKFKEVAEWFAKTNSPEEVKEFNETLASVPKLAQQALLKELYSKYSDASEGGEVTLHTNTPQTTPTKGYASESDFFKDISSPDYRTHKSFAKAVEAKLAKTNTEGWSIE
jgi:hypothetical protein